MKALFLVHRITTGQIKSSKDNLFIYLRDQSTICACMYMNMSVRARVGLCVSACVSVGENLDKFRQRFTSTNTLAH